MESVLKAMKYGSTKASALFPIILQKFESLSVVSIKEIFITEVLYIYILIYIYFNFTL